MSTVEIDRIPDGKVASVSTLTTRIPDGKVASVSTVTTRQHLLVDRQNFFRVQGFVTVGNVDRCHLQRIPVISTSDTDTILSSDLAKSLDAEPTVVTVAAVTTVRNRYTEDRPMGVVV